MPYIGSRKYARRALAIANGERGEGRDFKRIGSGSYRVCLLHKPTGVVYKIDDGCYSESDWENAKEIANARKLSKQQFKHMRIPKVSGYKIDDRTVLAMEYVEGTLGRDLKSGSYQNHRHELYSKGRFEDMHGDNFILDKNEKIVPIDMASPMHPKKRAYNADTRVLNCGDGSLWG